jgi:hypothetical protein
VKAEQRIQRFFSPLIIAYCAIVVLVLGFILYVAFSRTTVIVTLAQPADNYSFTYGAEELGGEAITAPVTNQTTFTQYEGESEDAIARGTVTIVNSYSAAQPLIKTTRLLSQEGVLFRTDDTVTVPAGGSVTVPVYADQAGPSGNIGPSKFEIVALWDGLKDNIYGESSADMTGGVIKRVIVTDALAEKAEIEATDALPAAATAALQTKTTAGTVTDALVLLEGTSTTVQPAIGETGDSITVTATTTASTVVFEEAVLEALITRQSTTADLTQLNYTLTRTNQGGLRVAGSVPLPQQQANLDFIDRASLTSKTPQQIQETLLTYDQVMAVEVQITPFWATRSPSLEQQIHLEMAQPTALND